MWKQIVFKFYQDENDQWYDYENDSVQVLG